MILVFSLAGVFAEENQTNTTIPESFVELSNTTEENATAETGNETEAGNETAETQTEIPQETGEETNTSANATALVCIALQCDMGCTLCSDGSCHPAEEMCRETIAIEKITPTTINKGEEQMNIVVRNTGNVALQNIEAQISGYGVTTQETISIETLLAGEKDYTFTKIVAEQSGTIDLVVKIYANGSLVAQNIAPLTVLEDVGMEVIEEVNTFNTTAAAKALNETRTSFNALEKQYYEKEKQGYLVYGLDEDLDDIKEYLRLAQVAIIEADQKEFEKNKLAAKTSIETVEAELAVAEKEEKTVLELLSQNLALIGSLLGVFISAITVWSMTKMHLKKAKVVNIIKGKQIFNVNKDTEVTNVVKDKSKPKDL